MCMNKTISLNITIIVKLKYMKPVTFMITNELWLV